VARCTFCSAPIDAPPGVAVRCASCGNLTTTPSIPQTLPAEVAFPLPAVPPPSSLPFARVDAPKQGAAPPPAVVMPSRAGGVDELIGGGITILGISLLKLVLIGIAGLFLTCLLGMLGLAFHR
jgi:hypothetical protein